jgi:hypothetical protein
MDQMKRPDTGASSVGPYVLEDSPAQSRLPMNAKARALVARAVHHKISVNGYGYITVTIFILNLR